MRELILSIRGLEYYGFHGVPAAERETGHRYRIDAEWAIKSAAGTTDSVDDTVDYSQICHELRMLGTTESFYTVERLATASAELILRTFPKIEYVTIHASKVNPPIPQHVEEFSVTVTLFSGDV